MNLTLKIFRRDQLRQTVRLERRTYLLGRSLSCDIIIPDNRVSRKHCSITFDPEKSIHLIYDLGSKQGTILNGSKLSRETPLRPDDVITFGKNSHFIIKVVETESHPLITAEIDSDDSKVESEVGISTVKSVADAKKYSKRLSNFRAGQVEEDAAIALELFDLLVKMSMAIYPKQEYQIFADYLFESTPAERLLIIRLHPKKAGDSTARLPKAGKTDSSLSTYQYSIEFSAHRPDSPTKPEELSGHFSRSMIMRSISGNQAILFTGSEDKTRDPSTPGQTRAKSSICAPLIGHNEVLGCLYIDIINRGHGSFADEHLQLASMASYFFALYLERERALEKKSENERLASAGLAVFGAAHHLKNILTALQGSRQVVDRALKKEKYDTIDETWAILSRSVDRLQHTIRQMLDFAREDYLTYEQVDLNKLIQSMLDELALRANDAQVELMLQPEENLPKVSLDAGKIDDVIRNLVINAIEALAEVQEGYGARVEEPLVVVRTELYGDSVVIEIIDNGTGIPTDVQPRLFDLFFTTKGNKGTGLGLAVSRKHIRQHGGDLTFESDENGTVFRIMLPLQAEEAPHYHTKD